jgi:predicted permease
MEELFLHAFGDARGRGLAAVVVVCIAALRDLASARIRYLFGRDRVRLPAADSRSTPMLGSDVRFALRALARQKASAALVIGMLALGIAANIAVFSFINGLFLRPFPFPAPDRLVYVNEKAPRWHLDVVGVKYQDFQDWHDGAQVFDSLALYRLDTFSLSGDARPERIRGARVSVDFARVLGISPVLGRNFTLQEDRPNGPLVALIGERMWRERYNGDPNVIGKPLHLDGNVHTIIGVLPREADFPGDVDLWVPIAADPTQPGPFLFEGIGRLKPGVSVAEAERDLLRAHEPSWRSRDKARDVSPFARSLHDEFAKDFGSIASTLFAGVAVLLIVACANVASVMLARTLARRREMATRLALGASRGRLVRQLFVENLILASIGGLIGLVLGQWAVRVLVATLPEQLPRWAKFDGDVRLFAFSIASVVATVLLFGWAPALHAVRGDLRTAVQEVTNGTTASPRGRRTLWCLVAGEFAMAALLLVCGGLLLRSFDRVRHVDPGFRTDHVLMYRLTLPQATYPGPAPRMAFWDRLVTRTLALPGVRAAGLVSCPPLGCHMGYFFNAEGQVRGANEESPVVLLRIVSPGYFDAMGIRLRAGRFFDNGDMGDGSPKPAQSIIVNETFAKSFWPDGANPVGRRIRLNGDNVPWLNVVGVVHDIKHYGLERPMRPGVYVPMDGAFWITDSLTMAVHTTGEPIGLVSAARGVVTQLDPALPMYQVQSMEQALHKSLRVRATYSWLLAAFAALAFALALGGAYGVASYLVSQRTREIGIRVALGAQVTDITRNILGHGLTVVAVGVAIGLAASFAAARVMSTLLFDSTPRDLPLLAIVTLALLATALLAQLFPARRAARVDPMRCLRSD